VSGQPHAAAAVSFGRRTLSVHLTFLVGLKTTNKNQTMCVVSGFRRGVIEIFTLLGCCAS